MLINKYNSLDLQALCVSLLLFGEGVAHSESGQENINSFFKNPFVFSVPRSFDFPMMGLGGSTVEYASRLGPRMTSPLCLVEG